jgi:hypothetical protein
MKKDGKYMERQLWRCKNCWRQSSEKRKAKPQRLWKQYSHGKQTYDEIGKKFKRSKRWVQQQIDLAEVRPRLHTVGDLIVVMDTTYFGKVFSVMVFRCPHRRKNLLWKFMPYETVAEYVAGIEALVRGGWNILGIVCDARRGLVQAFPRIPVQMCQFHQVMIVLRYITRKPKLEAGKELKDLVLLLTETDEASFRHWLQRWHKRWADFLAEKTVDEITKRWHFTHKRLRSAYRSLETNLPWLFTFAHYPDLHMPNTTNSIEGMFTHIKKKIALHSGLRIDRKQKLIQELLRGK